MPEMWMVIFLVPVALVLLVFLIIDQFETHCLSWKIQENNPRWGYFKSRRAAVMLINKWRGEFSPPLSQAQVHTEAEASV